MKARFFKVLNFLAFNLLFFALYLNFVHKDNPASASAPSAQKDHAVKGTVLVTNPDQYLHRTPHATANEKAPLPNGKNTAAASPYN